MRVRIEIDRNLRETEAVLRAPAMTGELLMAERLLQGTVLNGYRDQEVVRLSVAEILRIYCEQQKVFAETAAGVYRLRQRLYELEEQLDNRLFLRISNSEIVNLDAIRRLDISMGGTIGVELVGGIRTYASRRYVRKLRDVLEL